MKYRNPLLPITALAVLLGSLGGAAAAASPAADAPRAEGEARKPAKKDVACDMVTGSRIRPAKDRQCQIAGSPVRTYTQRDLEMTGEINVADALRKLDPAFR